MTPSDLDNMYDALTYLIDKIVNQSSRIRNMEKDVLQAARAQCRQMWGSYFMDTTL
jgi:hypothetical protein